MAQINGGETFTDVDPGDIVTSARLNNMTDGATLLNGSVLDQQEKTATVDGDFVLLGDSALPNTGIPKKVQIINLLSQNARSGVAQFALDTGATNAYAVALTPSLTSYAAGQVVRFKASNANTGASTINVNSVGVANITTRALAALAANDILSGQVVTLIYDGTQFQLITALSVNQVTATQQTESARSGVPQYQSAITTYVSNTYGVTLAPAATTYTAGMTVKFKAPNSCAAGDKISVNGLPNANIFRSNGATNVAVLANDIVTGDIVTLIYDGSNFILQRLRGWDFVDTAQALPGSTAVLTRPHGFGVKPSRIRVTLINVTANLGYNPGDEAEISSTTLGWQISSDATNITVAQENSSAPNIISKTGGGAAGLNPAYWNIKVVASV